MGEETSHPGHASELAKEWDLASWSAIATVSGDGLFHEVIQGLMDRPDWDKARRIPLALIPAGSGNGVTTSLDIFGAIDGTFCLIKGYTEQVDLMALATKAGRRIYCHLALFWGLIADADLDSNAYRWMGPARFTIYTLYRIVFLRSYPARLRYLLAENHEGAHISESNESEALQPPLAYSESGFGPLSEGWKEFDESFVMLCAVLMHWVSQDVYLAPGAQYVSLFL